MPEPKRGEIASRMVGRGYDPNIVYELTQEGLSELERRLDELKLLETKFNRLSQRNWISWLVSPRGRKKTKELRLQYDDLPKDPARVKKMKIERLKRASEKFADELALIENQIKSVMGYEDSGDQLANLEYSKARIEKELKQNQEEIDRLLKDD